MFIDSYRSIAWGRVWGRLWSEIWKDDVFGRAAQLAYFLLFSLVPILLIVSVILGYVAQGPDMRQALLHYLQQAVPGSSFQLIRGTLDQLPQSGGGFHLLIGIVTTLWAASSAMTSIIAGLNSAYGIRDARRWWKARILAVVLTLGMAVFIVIALTMLLYGSELGNWLSDRFGLGAEFRLLWSFARWPLVVAFAVIGFVLVYRWAPNLEGQKWRWILPGAGAGVGLWLLLSLGLRLYLRYVNAFPAVYRSLGEVLILLLWLYLSSAALLIGGELNSEIEHAAAKSGRTDAKLPGEKAPNEREQFGRQVAGPARPAE